MDQKKKDELIKELMSELEKGYKSAEKEGWLDSSDVEKELKDI